MMISFILATILAGLGAASTGATIESIPQRDDRPSTPQTGVSPMKTPHGIANLPFARGKAFKTLDAYLAHLEALGAIDLPWWREIKPGVYEHVVQMPNARRETATREELSARFGFTQ